MLFFKRCKGVLSKLYQLTLILAALAFTQFLLKIGSIDSMRQALIASQLDRVYNNYNNNDNFTTTAIGRRFASSPLNLPVSFTSSQIASFIEKLPVINDLDCDRFLRPNTFPSNFKSYFYKAQTRNETFNYDNCTELREQGFKLPVTKTELNHPIAFSILVYRDAAQVTRLIRAIYRPHIVYCIHVDLKSDADFFKSVKRLSACLQNVFLAPTRLDVKWSKFTVLEPELVCMQFLLRHGVRWKTWINLTGQEFPLKTNLELVKICDVMKGINDVVLDNCTHGGPGSTPTLPCDTVTKNGWMERWPKNAGPPPYGIVPYKGSVHVVLSRDFVHFLMTSQPAQAFLRWLKSGMRVPDEFLFSSINYNLHLKAPGSSHNATVETRNIARLKFWRKFKYKNCLKLVRYICIFSLQELPILTSSYYLFANKFLQNFSPLGYSCLERWYFQKVLKELSSGDSGLDLNYYRHIYSSYR